MVYNKLIKEVDLMFDDPKKELQELEEQLLALEPDEDFERFYEDIYSEFGEEPMEDNARMQDLKVEPPKRPHSNTYSDSKRYAAPVKKDNSIRNLTIIACLETAAIVGIVLWWVLRLM